MSPPDDAESAPAAPVLRIVHGGEPTAEEVAALVAAVQLRRTASADTATATPSRWASRRELLRRPLASGPGAWLAGARSRG